MSEYEAFIKALENLCLHHRFGISAHQVGHPFSELHIHDLAKGDTIVRFERIIDPELKVVKFEHSRL